MVPVLPAARALAARYRTDPPAPAGHRSASSVLPSPRSRDPWKSIRDQQVQDLQRIARVRFLLAHHRSTDLSRISDPEFVPVFTEHSFEPRCVARGLHPDAGWIRKSGVKLPGFPRLVASSPNRRKACLIAAIFSGGHGFSLGAVPGAARPNSSLQCSSHTLSGTKPCWREIHFWIS